MRDDVKRAGQWPSCAVGEHSGEYEEYPSFPSLPWDDELAKYGIQFGYAVTTNDIKTAQSVYHTIQQYFKRKEHTHET